MLIQNPDAAQAIRDQAKLTLTEGFPQNLLPNVQPVMDMTPRNHRLVNSFNAATKTTSSSSDTVFTTPTDRDLYITQVIFGFVKDAACDTASGAATLRVTSGGQAKTIAALPVLTLTAQDSRVVMNFNPPMKADRNTNCTMVQGTFTAGAFVRVTEVIGYELT